MAEREELLTSLQMAAREVLGEEAPVLTEDMSLGENTVDSLDLVEILMIIEEQEGFVIDGEQIASVRDIRGLIDAIVVMRATVRD